MKNLKIEVNEKQPLDEIVKELVRLGYENISDDFLQYSEIHEYPSIVTYNSGCFVYYCHNNAGKRNSAVLTTLSELKEM